MLLTKVSHLIKMLKKAKLLPPEDIHSLSYEETTLAEALKQKGYITFYAGKWHLGEEPKSWPEHHGFDINKGGFSWGRPKGGYYSPYDNPRLEDGPEGEHLTDRLGQESIDFLELVDEHPFLLFLSFYSVHTPIQGHKKYDDFYLKKKQALPELPCDFKKRLLVTLGNYLLRSCSVLRLVFNWYQVGSKSTSLAHNNS